MEDIEKTAARKLNEGADRLHDGIERGRKAGMETLDKASPMIEDALERARMKGEAVLEKARSKGQDLLDDAEASGEKLWKEAKTFVQKKPVQAFGVALLVGVAVGALLFSSRKD